MKLALCCGVAEAPRALMAGFDAVELGAAELASRTDPLPAELRGRVLSTNLFFGGGVRLYGVDESDWRSAAVRSLEAAAKVGVRTMVLGSGGARQAPPEAGEWLERFCDRAAEIQMLALPYGTHVAPESLNALECNLGNHFLPLREKLRARGVGWTLDTYHVLKQAELDGEDPSKLDWAALLDPLPTHLHVADLPRFAPRPEDPIMLSFFRALVRSGYEGVLSLECQRGEEWIPEAVVGDVRELIRQSRR